MPRMANGLLVSGLLVAASAATSYAAPSVGVVNIPQVSEKYARTADLEAQFEDLRRRLGQERDAMKERIDKANKALQEEIKPGTDAFRQRRREIALMEAELQFFTESEGQRVEKGLADSLKSIFTDIQSAVAEVAKEKGIDIVLAADQLPNETPDSPTQVRQHILLQKVLFWTSSVDITEPVTARLNEKYKASSGSGSLSIDSVQIKPKDVPPPANPPKKP